MATGRVPTTANSPLTAKGDLFGYSTTQARVAVGNDGETLVADSSTSTGLRYQGSIAGGKNFVINGGMDIWQRGTSFAVGGPGASLYSVDRWTCYAVNSGTIAQDTSLSASGFRYGLKFTSSAASGGNEFYQLMETDQVVPLAGKQVAVSGYALAPNGKTPSMNLEYSTTVNDGLFGTYVQCTKTTISEPTATGSLLRYTYSFAVPSTAKTLRLRLACGTLNNTEATTWTGVQLELGNVPTSFSRAGGTIQGELAACRYYYRRNVATGNAYGSVLGFSTIASGTTAATATWTEAPMRAIPTSVDFANIALADTSGAFAISAVALSGSNTLGIPTLIFTSTGLTQFRPYFVVGNNNAAGYLGISAEL